MTTQDLSSFGGLLGRALKARGFAALTGPQVFTAPEPGTLTQRIFARRTGTEARVSAAKDVLIAAGRRAFPAAGRRTLRSELTATGRRMTKRAKKLKLRIVTRFAPRAGSVLTLTRRVTVKRRGG